MNHKGFLQNTKKCKVYISLYTFRLYTLEFVIEDYLNCSSKMVCWASLRTSSMVPL